MNDGGVRDAGRALARRLVAPLPLPVADVLRRGVARGGAPRGRLHQAALRALYAGGIPTAVSSFRLADNPDLEFLAVDSQVLGQLYWAGEAGWEPELLPWWRRLCRGARSVLELGANVGYFSVQGGRAAPDVRYVAVEPHPFSAEICRAHLALNEVDSVQLVEAAAVADPGVLSVSLHVPSDQQATPTVAFLPADTELPGEMARDVTAVLDVGAIDVRELLDGVDLIKLDVEGQEHLLLAAAREHLREHHPTLVVEVLPGTAKLRALLADLCRTDGYRCYALSRRGPVELAADALETVRLRELFGCQDVILCGTELPQA